ncbi:glycosyltransferase family 4 protein [Melioribacter sp. Ez-97]|uniref:glycosyltransferase family 4 protein n=1 Tax=Melioribacter sp. Ez-97 TaxID=3423434 RepID=UPI003EDB3FED
MKIAFDCRVLNKGLTGTGRFLQNILAKLPEIDKNNEYYLFTTKDLNVDTDYYRIIKRNFRFPYKIFSPFWMNLVIPKMLEEYKIEIFISPNINLPFYKIDNVRYVTVIHDVIPFIYKEYYSLSYRTYLKIVVPRALKVADKVLTVSEHSKKDIERLFDFPSHKIDVTYNTVNECFYPMNYSSDERKIKLELPEKYLLYVGAIEKRKNILGLINIVDSLWSKGYNLPLVIVGKANYGYEEIRKKLEKRKERILIITHVSDEELNYLYNKAFIFLFPSFYEGFGIPPLEAMKCGLPVIASNTSSLPEVVGEGGFKIDPNNVNAFVDTIISLLKDNDRYFTMKRKALEQADKFNIHNITHKFFTVINELK